MVTWAIVGMDTYVPTKDLRMTDARILVLGNAWLSDGDVLKMPVRLEEMSGSRIDGQFSSVSGELWVVNCVYAYSMVDNGLGADGQLVKLLKHYGVKQVMVTFSEQQTRDVIGTYCPALQKMQSK